MSGFSLLDVQQSLYSMLSKDPVLVATGWRVFDHVEENEDPPYIILDNDDAADNSTKDVQGMIVQPELHFWSRDRGYKRMKAAMARVYLLLHMKPSLQIEGMTTMSHVAHARCMSDPDGITRHGVMRLSVMTYERLEEALMNEGDYVLQDESGQPLETEEEP